MARVVRETLRYFTDKGDEVAVRIDYSPNVSVSPEDRYELGGFDLDDDRVVCGLLLDRRIIKPRFVVIETEDNEVLPTIIKDLDTYLDLLDDPELSFGKITKRTGEVYNRVCSNL